MSRFWMRIKTTSFGTFLARSTSFCGIYVYCSGISWYHFGSLQFFTARTVPEVMVAAKSFWVDGWGRRSWRRKMWPWDPSILDWKTFPGFQLPTCNFSAFPGIFSINQWLNEDEYQECLVWWKRIIRWIWFLFVSPSGSHDYSGYTKMLDSSGWKFGCKWTLNPWPILWGVLEKKKHTICRSGQLVSKSWESLPECSITCILR